MTEKTFEALLREAVRELVKEELESFPSEEELKKSYCLSEQFYLRMERLVQSVERRQTRRSRRIRAVLCAACVLLAVIWCYPDIFARAENVIWEWFDKYIGFYFEHEEPAVRKYETDYLPDGYEPVYDILDENIGISVFQNERGEKIELNYTFAENQIEMNEKGTNIMIYNVEGTDVYYLKLNDNQKGSLLWKDEEYDVSFTLVSDLDYEEMEKIRKGIHPADTP